MVIGGAHIRVSKPGGGCRSVNMAATVNASRSFIKRDDEKGVRPIGTCGNEWNERLEKSITLGGGSIVHIVDHVWDNEG